MPGFRYHHTFPVSGTGFSSRMLHSSVNETAEARRCGVVNQSLLLVTGWHTHRHTNVHTHAHISSTCCWYTGTFIDVGFEETKPATKYFFFVVFLENLIRQSWSVGNGSALFFFFLDCFCHVYFIAVRFYIPGNTLESQEMHYIKTVEDSVSLLLSASLVSTEFYPTFFLSPPLWWI